MSFEKEEIPNGDLLYYRIHRRDIDEEGVPIPGAFKEQGEGDQRGMSTNWSQYSEPKDLMKSKDSSVGRFIVGEVRAVDPLTVEHDPVEDNRAHTHILGMPQKNNVTPKKTEIREKLQELFEWEIEIDTFEFDD